MGELAYCDESRGSVYRPGNLPPVLSAILRPVELPCLASEHESEADNREKGKYDDLPDESDSQNGVGNVQIIELLLRAEILLGRVCD